MEKGRNKIKSVCVYCASSTQVDKEYYEAATELGRLLGGKQIRVINGAGNTGLMCAVSDGALEVGGKVTGVIPLFMVEQHWCHQSLTELIEVNDMHERKQLMANLSDAVIALPGGCGTRIHRCLPGIRPEGGTLPLPLGPEPPRLGNGSIQ